jgi:Protein of unknown function (DUF3383)
MSIRFTKYINITSVVAAAAQVPQRQWCGRIFTTNPMVGPNAILQFNDFADVGTFFGTSSEEYARAAKYFVYLSPAGTAPQALQFARYVPTAQPATIYGEVAVAVFATLKAITAGLLSFKFGATQVNLTGITFAAAATLTDVASELQTAIRAGAGAPNGELTSATVTWNATAQAFDFSASPTGVVTELFQVVIPTGAVPATDVAAALGWYAGQGALVNDAQALETAVAGFSRVTSLNNNCGEIVWTDTAALAQSDVTAIGQANAALNVMFIFRVYVTPADWMTYSAALIGIAGMGLEYEDIGVTGARQYLEMLPMAIHASINFNAVNGAQGFMYKQNGVYTASINDNPGTVQSDALDAARVNYYGQTQTGGANISFYQSGVLMGGATAPVDSTVFANEQWFKDMCGANLMNLQLSVNEIPANKRGQTMCDVTLQGQPATSLQPASGIELAVRNGTISAHSTLSLAQQAYITQQTGSATAWQQVQTIGYWKGSTITSAVVSGVTTYTYNYTIIYRKDDVIKTIVGSHQLI